MRNQFNTVHSCVWLSTQHLNARRCANDDKALFSIRRLRFILCHFYDTFVTYLLYMQWTYYNWLISCALSCHLPRTLVKFRTPRHVNPCWHMLRICDKRQPLLDSYLRKFMWKQRNKNTNLFVQILMNIAEFTPPQQALCCCATINECNWTWLVKFTLLIFVVAKRKVPSDTFKKIS